MKAIKDHRKQLESISNIDRNSIPLMEQKKNLMNFLKVF